MDSGSFKASKTSIRYVASQVTITFEELLRGASSFGGYIQNNNFVAVPSPEHPGPNGDKYFRLNFDLILANHLIFISLLYKIPIQNNIIVQSS